MCVSWLIVLFWHKAKVGESIGNVRGVVELVGECRNKKKFFD